MKEAKSRRDSGISCMLVGDSSITSSLQGTENLEGFMYLVMKRIEVGQMLASVTFFVHRDRPPVEGDAIPHSPPLTWYRRAEQIIHSMPFFYYSAKELRAKFSDRLNRVFKFFGICHCIAKVNTCMNHPIFLLAI